MDLGVAENDEQRESTYRFLNDEISARHAALMEEARNTDTKATVVAGFAAAFVSFLLEHRGGTIWWAAMAAGLAALVCALAALWPRHWAGLSTEFLGTVISEVRPVVAVSMVADAKIELFRRNSRRARHKAVLWARSVALLAVGVTLSVMGTISEVQR